MPPAKETRTSILDAYAKLQARYPGQRFTLASLAREAGVSRMTVNRLFGTKQELLRAAAAERGLEAEDFALAPRQRILRAAGRVFARRGIAAATMAGIAGQAGVGVATLYRLFGSKEALFVAFMQEQGSVPALAELNAGGDPRQDLRGFARSLLRFGHEHLDLFVISMREAESQPKIKELLFGRQERTMFLLADYLRDLQAAGKIRSLAEPRVLALDFFGLLMAHIFMAPVLYGLHDGDSDRQAEHVAELFLHGVGLRS